MGGAAKSGKTCRLGSREGRAATSNMDASTVLAVVINVTPWFFLVAVVFLFFIGYQGTATELSQWHAKNAKADLINTRRERDNTRSKMDSFLFVFPQPKSGSSFFQFFSPGHGITFRTHYSLMIFFLPEFKALI